ncbi:hypothetical protein ACWGJW_22495, partial [Streptomyces nigrescens]
MTEPDTPSGNEPSSSSSSKADASPGAEVTGIRRHFTSSQVEAAAEAMGPVADLLTPHLHSGGPGPERKITVLGLLVGLHLACAGSGGQRVHLAEAARILGWWIPAQARERLGITDVPAVETASAFEALEGRVRRLFHDIETVCDPSPLPKNRRLDREEAQR